MAPKTPKKGHETSSQDEPPMTPSAMKVAELKEALTARGLSPKGLKKELIERLEDALQTEPSKLQDVTTNQELHEGKDTSQEVQDNIDDNQEQDNIKREQEQDNIKEDEQEPIVSTLEENVLSVSSTFVRIDRFVRPFTTQAAKDLIAQFGTVRSFWMDSIKSFAFVEYENEMQAHKCRTSLNGVKWPAETGKQLVVTESSLDARNMAIEEESTKKTPVREPESKRLKIGLDELFLKTQIKPHLYYLPAK